MPITFTAAREAPTDADVLGVPVLTGRAVPEASEIGFDEGFLEGRGFEGKVGETLALPDDDGRTVVAVGVGDRDAVDAEVLRRAAAAFVRCAWRSESAALELLAAAPDTLDRRAAAQAVVEGAAMAAYRFTEFKSSSKPCRLERLAVVGTGGARLQGGIDRGVRVADAVAFARDLVNRPAGDLTPAMLADIAVEMAQREGLQATVLDEVAIEGEGLGGLRGVSLGSDEPPRLIELIYEPSGRARGTVALVGKGITFDSGGLSLKTADGMMTMKTDMGGAAAVIATMSALTSLGAKTRVIGIVPATENMPGGRAIKPGDVLKARNGKTMEVLNTDAEGRLVLADGLSLAVEASPDAIADIATLTGAAPVALGRKIAALMGNHDGFVGQVSAASERAGEPTWVMPLPDMYRKDIDSDVADVKNIGKPGQAGTLIGGLFLKEFVADVPWAHLDIAGPARSDEDDGYIRKGGTGYGVRTLIELALSFEKPKR